MPDLRKVTGGDGLVIPAGDYNAFVDAARAERARRGVGAAAGPVTQRVDPASLVLARNDLSQPLPLWSVVVVGGEPLVSPVTDPQQTQRRPAFPAAAPTAATDQPLILIDPASSGAFARAVASGVAVCQLTVTDTAHLYARCGPGDTATLHTDTAGPARILWREAGTGVKWAVVLLGVGTGSDVVFVKVSGGSESAGYSGSQVELTAANTWTPVSPAVTFTNKIWRAPSNRTEASGLLPVIQVNQVIPVRPSRTFPPVAGVTQYETTAWGGQVTGTHTYLGTDCKGYQVSVTARDLVMSVVALSPPPPPPPPPPTVKATLTGYPEPGVYPPGTVVKLELVDISGGTPAYTTSIDGNEGSGPSGANPYAVTYSTPGTYYPTGSVTDSLGNSTGGLIVSNGNNSGKYVILAVRPGTLRRAARATAAQFDVTASTTLADVPDLAAELPAGTTYLFDAYLYLTLDATGLGQVAVGVSSAPTAIRTTLDGFSTSIRSTLNLLVTTTNADPLALTAVSVQLVRVSGRVTTNAAGTLSVQFAQSVANGTSSVLAGSWMAVEREGEEFA